MYAGYFTSVPLRRYAARGQFQRRKENPEAETIIGCRRRRKRTAEIEALSEKAEGAYEEAKAELRNDETYL